MCNSMHEFYIQPPHTADEILAEKERRMKLKGKCCALPTCDASNSPPYLEGRRCGNCGKFCNQCPAPTQKKSPMFRKCSKCGTILTNAEPGVFCAKCGKDLGNRKTGTGIDFQEKYMR